MKRILVTLMLLWMTPIVFADAIVDEKAPDFAVRDAQGKLHKLADYQGKYLVLEWYNKDCPYVRKHYDSSNMQNLQQELTDRGVVWLSVVSSAPGKQGHQTPEATLENAKAEASHADAILLDESGDMGRAYGAKTTPHMYVIDDSGVLRYKGAIDDKPSSRPATIETAHNYVLPAVNSVLDGKVVANKTSKPYGCSVKY